MNYLFQLISNKSNGSIIDLNSFLNRTDICQNKIQSLNNKLSLIFTLKDSRELSIFTETLVSNLYNAKITNRNTIFYDIKRNNEFISVKSSINSTNLENTLNTTSTKITSLIYAAYGLDTINNNILKILNDYTVFESDSNYCKIKDILNKELGVLSNRTFSLSAVWFNKKRNTIYIIKTKHIDSTTLLNESLKEWHNKIKFKKKHNRNKTDIRISYSAVLNIFNGIRDRFEIILLNSKINKNKLIKLQKIKNEINNTIYDIYDEKKLKKIKNELYKII